MSTDAPCPAPSVSTAWPFSAFSDLSLPRLLTTRRHRDPSERPRSRKTNFFRGLTDKQLNPICRLNWVTGGTRGLHCFSGKAQGRVEIVRLGKKKRKKEYDKLDGHSIPTGILRFFGDWFIHSITSRYSSEQRRNARVHFITRYKSHLCISTAALTTCLSSLSLFPFFSFYFSSRPPHANSTTWHSAYNAITLRALLCYANFRTSGHFATMWSSRPHSFRAQIRSG